MPGSNFFLTLDKLITEYEIVVGETFCQRSKKWKCNSLLPHEIFAAMNIPGHLEIVSDEVIASVEQKFDTYSQNLFTTCDWVMMLRLTLIGPGVEYMSG